MNKVLEYGICIQDHSRHAIVLQHVTSLPSTELFALKSKRQNNNISPENFEDTKVFQNLYQDLC
jgi:hypothetical protein